MLGFLLSAIENEEDKSFFTEIYKEYKQTLFKTALLYLDDKSLAEDCVQETFLDLIKYLDAFKKVEKANRRKYISSACKYTAIRINNAGKPEVDYEVYDDDKTMISIDSNYGFSEHDRFIVVDAVNSLDEKYRDPFILRYFDGLSVNEISEKLGITPNLVSKRLSRARRKLYDLLKDEENDRGVIS